jgi:RNA polymerase sigma factor (sigma-70 family)
MDPLQRLFQNPGAPGHLEDILSLVGQELHHYARAMTGASSTAEDAVHDVLVSLLKQGPAASQIRNPRGWLFTVLRRKALEYCHPKPAELARNIVTTLEGDPASRLILEEVLQRLSTDEQEVVLLHLWEGMTFEDISEMLGIPRGTLLSRYHRCIQRLRVHFGEPSRDVPPHKEMSLL